MLPIYKICCAEEWMEALRRGLFIGSDVDRRDGFIHFSTRAQVAETVAKHFVGRIRLALVMVDADKLGAALKWEPSRGGALFPHLYGPLDVAAAVWVKALPDGAARAEFLAKLQVD
jgi:uncharacterized protein (DUF952 family)